MELSGRQTPRSFQACRAVVLCDIHLLLGSELKYLWNNCEVGRSGSCSGGSRRSRWFWYGRRETCVSTCPGFLGCKTSMMRQTRVCLKVTGRENRSEGPRDAPRSAGCWSWPSGHRWRCPLSWVMADACRTVQIAVLGRPRGVRDMTASGSRCPV